MTMLDTRQVAEMLNLSAATLISWRSKNLYGLKYYKLGRRVVYSKTDIESWLKRRQLR